MRSPSTLETTAKARFDRHVSRTRPSGGSIISGMPPSSAMHTWRAVFFAAALWTTLGAGLGFLDPARTFALFHGAPPVSEDLVQIYRGASGQSLLFAVG